MKKKIKNAKEYLRKRVRRHGAGHLVLLDPDKEPADKLVARARMCDDAGVDGLLIGGSFADPVRFRRICRKIYQNVRIPVILFPGESGQVIPDADAIIFMSLISGRNPDFLIEQQVRGAARVKKYGLETLSTGYMLIESGTVTAVQRASKTKPLSRNRTNDAVAHALAAQYLGMEAVYLEAGSGAKKSVPSAMIRKIAGATNMTVIVGGGIRTPAQAAEKKRAGAHFVVTGTVLEDNSDKSLLKEFLKAIHTMEE